jgi:S1-C subfamily serine protease
MSARSASSRPRGRWVLPALAAVAGVCPCVEASGGDFSDRVLRVYSERAPAVVRVEARDRHGELSGTGFFIDPAGTLFTLYSTVCDAAEVCVVMDGERVPAKVLVADARSGVALLKVDRATPFIPAATTKSLRLATPVVAIGYPHDLRASPSFGIIAGFDRQFLGKFFVTTHIRASLPVLAGFGGAPLLDLDGRLLGIVVAGIDRGAGCYALPVEAAEKIRTNFIRFGEVRHGWVGVTVEGVSGGEVRVAALGSETPAAASGIKEGDILLGVGDVEVQSVEDVLDASFFLTDGDLVNVRIRRDGRERTYPVSSIAHPSQQRNELHAMSVFQGLQLQLK